MKKRYKSKQIVDLEVILPVYNERDSIQLVVREWVKEFLRQDIPFRFIICEDGSIDGTQQVLKKLALKYPMMLNQAHFRRGYGKAVIDGINTANARYVLCIDSDGQCDPGDFGRFWEKRDVEAIHIGWRIHRADALQRKLFSGLFGLLFRSLFPTPIHDPSAPFVLFRRTTIIPYLSELSYMREGFWWGFVGMCIKHNIKISELPIKHRPRISGKTNVYQASKMPLIAIRNTVGLIYLRFHRG